MPKRMLIDAAHSEETRVVVLNGNRLEEFDFESSTKKQVKGNIYLAKVTRVEPSLQAAFVEYGGNRHGFLAFSEIHPDYYRIPVADRGFADQAASRHEAEEDGGEADVPVPLEAALPEPVAVGGSPGADDDAAEEEAPDRGADHDTAEAAVAEVEWPDREDEPQAQEGGPAGAEAHPAAVSEDAAEIVRADVLATGYVPVPDVVVEPMSAASEGNGDDDDADEEADGEAAAADIAAAVTAAEDGVHEAESVETIGGDEFGDPEEERQRSRTTRPYKIQEVIKRRQIMLVQVSKEERGNKGAALTTYLSLAGRYCVLMPNTGRGGGVSRKITSMSDRRRLKEILEDLDIPDGMGVIVRTAGSERSKAEIKRDYEYLLRLWNEIRDLTLKSTAPALIYEEGNLIKRSIRDLYTRDIDEVLVEGEEGYRTAKSFMRMLMPSHARRVQPHRDSQVGLFHRYQVEGQIDAIHSPVAQLRSGGYIVINQTEALVSIDVNSGRATRERNIEETALRTNLEAAEEIARQLRLRDLAGLIVIDFIDMEEHRNQAAVERRLKDALKNDRARIQVGRISPFGLLEMSRQRLRPSLAEASTQPCSHCGGTGFVRSVESAALHALRSIEEEGTRHHAAEICIYVPTAVALYILNQKRESLAQVEARYTLRVMVARDDSLIPPAFRLERLRSLTAAETAPPPHLTQVPALEEDEDEDEDDEIGAPIARGADGGEREAGDDERRRRRRRRRRSPRRGEEREVRAADAAESDRDIAEDAATEEARDEHADTEADRRRRRRGRRGGRRRMRREDGTEVAEAEHPVAAETIEILPASPAEPAPDEAPAPTEWPGDLGLEAASVPALADAEPAMAAQAAEVTEEPAEEAAPAPTVETVAGIPFAGAEEHEPTPAAAAAAAETGSAAPAPELASAADEQIVTDRPANPRRGWWQRLVQS